MSTHANNPRQAWERLTAATRTVRDDRDGSAPYAFSTRVAALAFVQERRVPALFDVLALRALGVASLLALFSIALNYSELSTSSSASAGVDDALVAADDAVAVVLDLAD